MASVAVHYLRCQSARFTDIGRTLKAMIGLAVAIATICSCSLIPMKPSAWCQKTNYRNGLQRSGRLGYGKDTQIGINTAIHTLKNSHRSE